MNIGLVGYGKLARHLAPALIEAGHLINQWLVRDETHHDEIFENYNVQSVIHANDISDSVSEVIILMVNDSSIEHVANQLEISNSIVCHTSGMTPLQALPFPNSGIFYPLNTFSGLHSGWDRDTPMLLQARNQNTLNLLIDLANDISQRVQVIDAEKAKILHMAAVISQNFSNYLISRAESILEQNDLDRALIQPLLVTMIKNVSDSPAIFNQTGPAMINDTQTIESQLKLLQDQPNLQRLYKLISEDIQSQNFH